MLTIDFTDSFGDINGRCCGTLLEDRGVFVDARGVVASEPGLGAWHRGQGRERTDTPIEGVTIRALLIEARLAGGALGRVVPTDAEFAQDVIDVGQVPVLSS